MNAYLLTWNPSKEPEGSDFGDMLRNSIDQEVMWSCKTHQAKRVRVYSPYALIVARGNPMVGANLL